MFSIAFLCHFLFLLHYPPHPPFFFFNLFCKVICNTTADDETVGIISMGRLSQTRWPPHYSFVSFVNSLVFTLPPPTHVNTASPLHWPPSVCDYILSGLLLYPCFGVITETTVSRSREEKRKKRKKSEKNPEKKKTKRHFDIKILKKGKITKKKKKTTKTLSAFSFFYLFSFLLLSKYLMIGVWVELIPGIGGKRLQIPM